MSTPRVNGAIRWGAFIAATYTLSLFFAGWREVNTTGHWTAWLLLAAGILLTGSLLMLQAYWIYFEEKNKGSLRKKSKFFEGIHKFVSMRFADNKVVMLIQPAIIEKEGNKE